MRWVAGGRQEKEKMRMRTRMKCFLINFALCARSGAKDEGLRTMGHGKTRGGGTGQTVGSRKGNK